MNGSTYAGRLRYLDADDIDDSIVKFDRLEVRGPDDRKLGDIDGFIVDSAAGRVYYVVVDSGGWFTSKRFLLPIGHATIDRDRGALRVDVASEALRRYPPFDADGFRELSDEELQAFEHRMAEACCPDDSVDGPRSTASSFDRRHYTQPDWWMSRAHDDSVLRPVEARSFDRRTVTTATAPGRRDYEREQVVARERDDTSAPGGRAQPGDVLGIESGGERTYMGDTAEDEDDRRREAERSVAEEESEKEK